MAPKVKGKFGEYQAAKAKTSAPASNQEEILRHCEDYWRGVLEYKDAEKEPDCPKKDVVFKDNTQEVASFTIRLLNNPEIRKKAGVEWVYAAIRLLRKLQTLEIAKSSVTELLLTRKSVNYFLRDLMTTDPKCRLEDRSAAEVVILYFNTFFISLEKADQLLWEEKSWRQVVERLVTIKTNPVSLNTLYYFTRFLFILGARQSKPAGPEIRKELVEHKTLVHFLVQCFNELLRDKSWPTKPDHCRNLADILRVLYNLTLHQQEFILHALQNQPFEKETIESVVNTLKLPLASDPNFDPKKFDQIESFSMVNVKMELVNLLMNTPKVITVFFGTSAENLEELGRLLEYRIAAAKANESLRTTACPFLMLLEQVCLESPAMANWWKKYLWGADATNGRKAKPGDLGGLRTEEEGTLRNNLLDFMTNTDFQLKACTGKMLLAICGDETEFFRLTGPGNAIGLMQLIHPALLQSNLGKS